MKEKKEIRWWIRKVALFVERIRNSFDRRKRIWWIGDWQGGAVLHGSNKHLRVVKPSIASGERLRKKFFEKESAESKQGFGKIPFFPTLIIIDAQIKERIKEHERLKAEKYARFMRNFRTMKKNDENI